LCRSATLPGRRPSDPHGTLAYGLRALPALLPEDGETLIEHLFQLLDGAPFEQHVPVSPLRLGLLRRGQLGVRADPGTTAAPALPGGRNLGLRGERHDRPMALRARVLHLLA